MFDIFWALEYAEKQLGPDVSIEVKSSGYDKEIRVRFWSPKGDFGQSIRMSHKELADTNEERLHLKFTNGILNLKRLVESK